MHIVKNQRAHAINALAQTDSACIVVKHKQRRPFGKRVTNAILNTDIAREHIRYSGMIWRNALAMPAFLPANHPWTTLL